MFQIAFYLLVIYLFVFFINSPYKLLTLLLVYKLVGMNNKLGFSRTLKRTLLEFIAYRLVNKSRLCNQRVTLPSNTRSLM